MILVRATKRAGDRQYVYVSVEHIAQIAEGAKGARLTLCTGQTADVAGSPEDLANALVKATNGHLINSVR